LGTILNDDAVPALSINDVSVVEGNSGTTNVVFTVSLSALSGQNVSVNWATADATATIADNDYVTNSGVLTIPSGQLTGSFTVVAKGDTKLEPNETLLVNLSGAVNATVADAQGIGTLLNDDAQPALSINDLGVTERNTGTTNAVFTVSLSNPSYLTVSVTCATANGTATVADNDYASASTTLTFNPGDVTKTFSVAVNGDAKFETSETFW